MAIKVLLILCAIFVVAYTKTVVVGQLVDYTGSIRLLEKKDVSRNAIPLLKRTDTVELTANQEIRGIALKDLDNGLADASIARGGLGFNYAVIKLKSERGSGYHYLLEIYG